MLPRSKLVFLTAGFLMGGMAIARAQDSDAFPLPMAVTQAGATATQVLVTYTSPGRGSCLVEVSSSSSFSPLVPDVDPALFPGANADLQRQGTIVNGGSRTVVIGKRQFADAAQDGRSYSRTLTPDTSYYLRLTCPRERRREITVKTSSLPYGNTYADTVTPSAVQPGTYPWPTIDTQTGMTTDPQSGVMMYPFGFGEEWPSGPQTVMFGHQLLNDGTGKKGYVFWPASRNGPNSGTLYWIDPQDNEIRSIGRPGTVYPGNIGGDAFTNQAVNSQSIPFSSTLGSFFAVNCATPCPDPASGKYVLLQGKYTGAWQAGDLGNFDDGTLHNVSWTNLSPASAGRDLYTLLQQFDSRFDPAMYRQYGPAMIGLTGDETKIILAFNASIQDTLAWVAVFDPASRQFTAAMPMWQSRFLRWCGRHSTAPVDGSGNWMVLTAASNGWVGNAFAGDGDGAGDGPWETTINAPLTSSPQYAPGTDLSLFGFPGVMCGTGAGCDIRTVSGPPCDPTPSGAELQRLPNCPGNPNAYYLMDAAPGDVFQVADGSVLTEVLQILGVNGSSWAIQRGWRQAPQNHTSTTAGMVCAVDFEGGGGPNNNPPYTYGASLVGWDFVHDPHGTGVNPAWEIVDSADDVDHAGFSNTHTAGEGLWATCTSLGGCIDIKTGADPSGWLNQASTARIFRYPPFASALGGFPLAQANIVETYTASGPENPAVPNASWVVHAAPVECCGFNDWSSLGGDLYRLTLKYGQVFNPKSENFLAACMGKPMLDVSSATAATSGPVAGLNSGYTYCYSANGGECYSGSAAGQVFANCPGFNNDTSQNYLIVASPMVGKVAQLRWDDPEGAPLGRAARPLTSSFRALQRYSSFWSARTTPGGEVLVTTCDGCGPSGQRVLFLVKLPAMQAWDGIDRTGFVPVNISVAGGHGSARVSFGYAENGDPSSFYCTTRQEGCWANATALSAPYFYYTSEDPAALDCNSGCSMQLPGISGRVLYYRIVYGDGTVSGTKVAAVP